MEFGYIGVVKTLILRKYVDVSTTDEVSPEFVTMLPNWIFTWNSCQNLKNVNTDFKLYKVTIHTFVL